MLRILLIEDDDNKKNDIIDYLNDAFPGQVDLDIAMSFNTGVRMATKGDYGLMLVDMTLPKFDKDKGLKERTLHNGGEVLIGYLLDLGKEIKSIVITQYDNFKDESLSTIDARLKVDCPESYLGAVKYNSSEDGWKVELNNYINNVIYSNH